MMYLAEVVSGDDWTVPICLACALAHPPHTSAPFRIQIHPNVAYLETVARSFEQLLRQPNCLDTSAGINVSCDIFCTILQHGQCVLAAQANHSDSFHDRKKRKEKKRREEKRREKKREKRKRKDKKRLDYATYA